MTLSPQSLKQYHVFLASPGDVNDERQIVRQFFERYNRHTAQLWGVRFEVVDWENYSSIGVGRPQELITAQTLERFKGSLALVIGIMAQRFGSPTGKAESGTEEEFRWALEQNQQQGFPEIKWFFKHMERFEAPTDPDAIAHALEQWKKVRAFQRELRNLPMYYGEYSAGSFKETLEDDLNRWLAEPSRPWVAQSPQREAPPASGLSAPDAYYQTLERDFHRLDISGIDNDRAFEIPLSEIYVRLRVMFDEELQNNPNQVSDSEAIDIQTALLWYQKLVIVGDPGSGKSTFLKYVALMLARSVLQNNTAIALEKLCIQEPLPTPMFVSCWDLSDYLRERDEVQLDALLNFIAGRLTKSGFKITSSELETLLKSGSGCLLFDGLDEVPTDAGRAMVSRLLEDCVKQFPQNRYVVTSRVRAYTGDTILKGEFARCDIQPFDANDRSEFLKNWVGLLFKTSPEQVLADGTDANREFTSLVQGIETGDRIRPLAINPLLLTVIAIVHWNRKRLPEQRVDLYDECVDVLLGQRKEAEHVHSRRKADAFSEQVEKQHEEERPWVRKRFAEIALRILQSEGTREEASKADVIRLLAPRFMDRGAKTQEEAGIQAARFLEKQELRSGLLVSRREHSYRFVHLTFQEYLAAWHLSNQELDQVFPVIESRLRQQRWFECLQLLGSEWAKQSDEKLDRYLQWLLERQGEIIVKRAPVVALCANIVKDTTGIAELTPSTRKQFQSSLEDTLDALRPASGVPANTQLEILEALGQLGAAVKSHLIDATKSGLFQVRSRAIEMLLPHLSEDELFGMAHLLKDRSKEPIKTYLRYLLSHNPMRTGDWLCKQECFLEKAGQGFTEIVLEFEQKLPEDLFDKVVCAVFTKSEASMWSWHRVKLVDFLRDKKLLYATATDDTDHSIRQQALRRIAIRFRDNHQTWQLIRQSTVSDGDVGVRILALDLLARGQAGNTATWELVRQYVTDDSDFYLQVHALELLIKGQGNDPQTWVLVHQCLSGRTDVRLTALEALLREKKNDPSTKEIVRQFALEDENYFVRFRTFQMLASPILGKRIAEIFFSTPLNEHRGTIQQLNLHGKISIEQVLFLVRFCNSSEQSIKKRFEELAKKLKSDYDLELKLEWLDNKAIPE